MAEPGLAESIVYTVPVVAGLTTSAMAVRRLGSMLRQIVHSRSAVHIANRSANARWLGSGCFAGRYWDSKLRSGLE